MKRLLIITFICFFTNPALAIQTYNGESKTYYISCSPAEKDVYLAAKSKIHYFTQEYKATTIKNNLKEIRFCKKLLLFGEDWAAGSYDFKQKIIYVETKKPFQQEYILHHEFSSILLLGSNKKKRIEKAFIKNSIGNYRRFKSEDWMQQNASFLKRGFVVPYAQTCFENDFNMIAAFYKTSFLRDRVETNLKYPLIYKKYNIVKEFYKKL